MDKGDEILSFYHTEGFFGSGNPGSRLQIPPGFNTQANPNLSSYCHSNMTSPRPPPPPPPLPPGFFDSLKRKRGRPRKVLSPAPAVGTPVVPTAPTPQNIREQNPELVHEYPGLSKLKPPSRSDGFRNGKEYVNLLKTASSVLISSIKEAKNANEMIELSSKAFMYFDSLKIDYTEVYKVVTSVIKRHCEKEDLAKQKPHSAFVMKAVHDQAVVEFSQAEGKCARVNKELEGMQRDFDAITAHVKRLMEELKNGNEKKAKLEAKVVAVRADKVSCEEAYSKAQSKVEKMGPKMCEAQKAIDEFERQWKETVDGLKRAMEETSNLGI